MRVQLKLAINRDILHPYYTHNNFRCRQTSTDKNLDPNNQTNFSYI